MRKITIVLCLLFSVTLFAEKKPSELKTIQAVKNKILNLSETYKGQADPDFIIQNKIYPYVERLVQLSLQNPVEQRLDKLVGAWQQVWGPYEYRKNDRSVDPATDPDNIYQVVFPGGYYYNVGNLLDKKTKEVKSVTLLRGEYKFNGGDDLKIKFTKLTKVMSIPAGLTYVDLPALSEEKKLKGEKKTLPDLLVRLTFPGGVLSEVYTDENMRIAIGKSKSDNGIQGYLYVMTRVND
jgi:hypothetical protein